MLKEVVAKEKEEVQPNPMIRSVGKTRIAMPVARKATHRSIALKMQKKKKKTIMSQERVQQAVLRSCARTQRSSSLLLTRSYSNCRKKQITPT